MSTHHFDTDFARWNLTTGRHTGFKAVSTGRGNNKPTQPTESPSPLMETFAKLSGTTIMCLDSQSPKLDFPIDSRVGGKPQGGRVTRVKQDNTTTLVRHCGLGPQSRRAATADTQSINIHVSPPARHCLCVPNRHSRVGGNL